MLCVDAAVIEKPVNLKPGEEWTGRLQLSVVPSSFCSYHVGLDSSSLWEDGTVQNIILSVCYILICNLWQIVVSCRSIRFSAIFFLCHNATYSSRKKSLFCCENGCQISDIRNVLCNSWGVKLIIILVFINYKNKKGAILDLLGQFGQHQWVKR